VNQRIVTTAGNGLGSLLGSRIKLPEGIDSLQQKYQHASPFPHLVMDNLFPDELMRGVVAEIPPLASENWLHHHDDHQEKFGLRSAADLGEYGTQLASLLHSASFLYFLSEITGIWGLLPDPYLQGGGLHVLPIGAKFDVHIDRKTDYVMGLRRRLALIVYLNEGWKPEYGGQLELWDKHGTRCEVSVEAELNRTVLFEVAEGNYHGNPNVIACPPGQTRNSFIVYYHTVPDDGRMRTDILSSVFAPSSYKKKFRMRSLVKDLTPPLLLRAMKRVMARSDVHRI
jgi:hypothetical protein